MKIGRHVYHLSSDRGPVTSTTRSMPPHMTLHYRSGDILVFNAPGHKAFAGQGRQHYIPASFEVHRIVEYLPEGGLVCEQIVSFEKR